MAVGSVLMAISKFTKAKQLWQSTAQSELSTTLTGKKLEKAGTFGNKKVEKTLNSYKEAGKQLQKTAVLKGIQSFSKIFSTIATVGLSPALSTMNMSFAALAEIFNAILTPLQPFFDVLSLLATMLEAALVPLTVQLYEGFGEVFDMIGQSIPELMAIVSEYIEDNEQLDDIIAVVKSGVESLIDALKNGLMEQIVDLVLNLLSLATIMVETNSSGKTLIQELIELAVAMTELIIAMKPLLPIIYALIDLVTALSNISSGMINTKLGNKDVSASNFNPLAPADKIGVLGDIFGFDSGGNPQQTMLGLLHPNDVVLSVDDPKTTESLSSAIDMTEMTGKQDMTNDLLVELINSLKRGELKRRK